MNVSRKAMQIRGDVPGLLRRGMPVINAHRQRAVIVEAVNAAPDRLHELAAIRIDYTDPTALYLSLHWLADRGHTGCLWMLPTTHGGRVEAWDGLTAWEVAAVLVSVSVGRVARGMGPIVDIRHAHSVVSRVAYVEAGYALCVPGGLVVPT